MIEIANNAIPALMPDTDYRDVIAKRLKHLTNVNSGYSLRAFARDLEISPSLLSDLLKGKRGLSVSRAFDVAKKLKLDLHESEVFTLLVQLEYTEIESVRKQIIDRIHHLRSVQRSQDRGSESFNFLFNWYNAATFELAALADFKLDAQHVAEKLEITSDEATAALKLLENHGLLKFNSQKSCYEKTEERFLLSSDTPNPALRHYHGTMLNKSLEALDNQSNREKFIGTETFAFDEDLLPKASAIIEDCFSKLLELSASSLNRRTELYQAQINLFRIGRRRAAPLELNSSGAF